MSDFAISAVNNAPSSQVSSSNLSKISEETKKKLIELGLDPSKYTTEAQAQAALIQTQATKSPAPQKPDNSDMNTIETKIKDLASLIGVSVGNSDKITDILSNISNKIGELQSSAGTDATKLAEINNYQTQFTDISSELAKAQSSKNMTGASALANYNKAALGLTA